MRFVLPILLAILGVGCAQAGFLYDWTTPGVLRLADPSNDPVDFGPAHDINAIWYAQDATSRYFRLDLPLPSDHSAVYVLGFLTDTPSGWSYPPLPTLTGIDSFVALQYGVPWYGYGWTGTSFSQSPATFSETAIEDADTHFIWGYALEWSLPLSALPDHFGITGVTQYPVGTLQDDTGVLDVGGGAVTPEPTSLALLGVGLGALYAKRRRRD